VAEHFIGLPKDLFTTPVHPAAALFPMMPDDELQALAEDIKKNGLRNRIVVILPDTRDGLAQIVDGRNRLRACQLAGVEPLFTALGFPRDAQGVTRGVTEYIVSCNLFRRHLTNEQRREVIAELLRENPQQSDRQIASQTKADHKTVGKVRGEMEGRGEIPHVARRTDSKGRAQPAGKPATERQALPVADGAAPDEPWITPDAWNALKPPMRKRLLVECKSKVRFNDQGDNENIEWALWSWNPVTGCRHNCPYCYARDIANRFYEQKFEPALWPGRLAAPRNTPFPEAKIAALAAGDPRRLGLKNVFTCSMADLFGRWVPSEWIEAVLAEVRAAPQWTFLFLTKFPARLAEFSFPANTWVGTTVDCQARVANAEKAFRKVKAGVKWLSVEPMIEPLRFSDLGAFQWLVLGGSSRSSQTPEWHPPAEWVVALTKAADRAGVPVYQKSNLFGRLRGYPGQPAPEPPAPEHLRYLPEDAG
jgi:protein gp37